MKLIPGVGLAARSLLRAVTRHRLRAFAGIFAGTMCVTLTMGVRVIADSVTQAITGTPIAGVTHPEWVVQARSSDGMSLSLLQEMQVQARQVALAPILLANTRVVGAGGGPIVVVGATPEIGEYLPKAQLPAIEKWEQSNDLMGVMLDAAWARSHHMHKGSTLILASPGGITRWHVVALARGQTVNRGAVVVAPLPSVAQVYRRPGVVDLVLASQPGSKSRLRAELRRAVGTSASVGPPGQTMDSYQRSVAPARNLLNVLVAIAVLASGAILFFSWRLALEDAREQLARLRLCGARMSHLALASAGVLGGMLALSIAIGAPLGILLGSSLGGFSKQLVQLTMLAARPGVPIAKPFIEAAGVSLVVFMAAIGVSVLTIKRMPVIEAVIGRTEVRGVRSLRTPAIVALIALASGTTCLAALPVESRQLALAPFLIALLALSGIAPAVLGAGMRRRTGFAALSAGRELALNGRRTAALLGVFATAIAIAIALEGAGTSLRQGIDRSVRAWTIGDLFVQTAQTGENLQDDKFAPNVLPQISQIPGVQSVGYFTYSTVELHNTRIPLWAWGPSGIDRYAQLKVTQGPSGPALWKSLGQNTVAISSNYARLYGTKLGQKIAIPAPDGHSRSLRVVAIIDDLTSAAGMIVVSPRLYETLTKDKRSYQIIVKLSPGASIAAVSRDIIVALRPDYPSLVVYDRAQIRRRFDSLTGKLVETFVVFGRIMFILAMLVGGATLATTLSQRQRSMALSRLLGAPVGELHKQLVQEALALGIGAWLIAAPIGIALVYTVVYSVATQSGLLPDIQIPVWLVVMSLPLAIVMSLLALLSASPRRRIPVTVTALAEE